MKSRDIKYYFREAYKGFRRNRVMSFSSVASVTATLIVIGIFLMMAFNINFMATNIESQVEIKAYLIDGLKEDTLDFSLAKVKEMEGVKDVYYTSKEQALEDYRKQLGEDADILNGLEDRNPLPASYTIILTDPLYAKTVATQVETFSSVEKTEYGREVLDKLLKITAGLRIGCIGLIVVLFLISTFIISNTIKLTVFARRREISIMKYVGATDWFVRWPFIIEGIFIGFLGSLITFAVLSGIYYYIWKIINGANLGLMAFELMPMNILMTNIQIVIVIIGVSIGFLGSALSVRKFLKV